MPDGMHRSHNRTWRFHSRGQYGLRGLVPVARTSLWEKDAPAQGMVEFALVLPVLLLILFGIIAFGHFFFNYSLVVAASREAARFGAAVGLTENSIPRYRDCDMIRAAAVQAGNFAGVDGTEATVQIHYDQGPKLDGTTVVYQAADPVTGVMGPVGCPIGEIGPGFIELGDRIAVTVTVDYQPIVPLIITDNIPLTATTRRTIMLGMPVGEQPIAETSECVGTLTRIVPPNWNNTLMGSTSLVGEPVIFKYEVIADEPDIDAKGKLFFYVNDVLYASPVCEAGAPIGSCTRNWFEITDLKADPMKPYVLRARYDPTGYTTTDPCFEPSKAEPLRHYILPADTELTILKVDPSPSEINQAVTVEVEVKPKAPAGGTPLGKVYVEEKNGATCVIDLVEFAPGVARGKCSKETNNPLVLEQAGETTIAATYDPGTPGDNPNYNSSSAAVEHRVGSGDDPSPIAECPAFISTLDVTSSSNVMSIAIRNQNEFINIPIDTISINWPAGSPVSLNAVRINDTQVWSAPAYPAPQFTPPLSVPGNYTLASSPPGFPVNNTMWFEFSDTLPTGDYSVTVTFGTPTPPITCTMINAFSKK